MGKSQENPKENPGENPEIRRQRRLDRLLERFSGTEYEERIRKMWADLKALEIVVLKNKSPELEQVAQEQKRLVFDSISDQFYIYRKDGLLLYFNEKGRLEDSFELEFFFLHQFTLGLSPIEEKELRVYVANSLQRRQSLNGNLRIHKNKIYFNINLN
jgi:hypothetical protein